MTGKSEVSSQLPTILELSHSQVRMRSAAVFPRIALTRRVNVGEERGPAL